MTDYDNTNSGALFKNDKKETEKHPDYKGSINAAGVDYWVSAWINTAKSGSKYMSIKLQAKDARTSADVAKTDPPKPASDHHDFGDDDKSLPF